MMLRIFLGLVLLAGLIAAPPACAAEPAAATAEAVEVPNFWDPRARLERPSAEEIGAIQSRPFDTLKAGLADRTGNAIIAGLDPEKAAAEGLIATQAYLKIPGRFVAPKDAAFDPANTVPARAIGVVCRSAHQAFRARFFPKLP